MHYSVCETDLVLMKKDRPDASVYKQLIMEIRDRYHDYIPVYTDGSRDGVLWLALLCFHHTP